MKHLLLITLVIATILNCTDNIDISGTADDVNNGTLFGELVQKNGKKIDDTVTVCLYEENSTDGLGKVHSNGKEPARLLRSGDGTYVFDSLAAGTYRIEVIKDSIVVGEKSDITIINDEDKEVNITIVIIINQTFNILTDESQHITINNFYIDNGKISESDSGYVLTTTETDTIVFELEIEDDGETSIATVKVIRNEDGSTTFEIVDSTEVGISIRSDTDSTGTDSTTNQVPCFTTQSDEMLDNIFADSTFLDTIHATDPDGDALTMTLFVNPDGMVLEDSIISWTTGVDDTGLHTISLVVNDDNGGMDTLEWSMQVLSNSTPEYPEIPYDSPMTGKIDPTVDVDKYWFTGTAGDLITLRVDPDGSASPDSRIQIVDPSGTVIANEVHLNSRLNTIEDVKLPSDGQYLIRVMESDGDETFDYEIVLYSYQHTLTTGTEIEYTAPQNGSITSRVMVNQYLFTGSEGDIVTLRVDPDGSASPDSRIQIIDPSGTVIANEVHLNSRLNAIEDVKLPSDGQYLIRVMESDGDETFDYEIILIN